MWSKDEDVIVDIGCVFMLAKFIYHQDLTLFAFADDRGVRPGRGYRTTAMVVYIFKGRYFKGFVKQFSIGINIIEGDLLAEGAKQK